MRELCRSYGGATVVAATVAVLEHHRQFNNNRFDDSLFVDSDGITRKRPPADVAAKNNACLENAAPDNLNQYKRRNGRVATQQFCDEKFESAVKDFNLVAEDVENSLRRQQQQRGGNTAKTAEVSSCGGENGRYVCRNSGDMVGICAGSTHHVRYNYEVCC